MVPLPHFSIHLTCTGSTHTHTHTSPLLSSFSIDNPIKMTNSRFIGDSKFSGVCLCVRLATKVGEICVFRQSQPITSPHRSFRTVHLPVALRRLYPQSPWFAKAKQFLHNHYQLSVISILILHLLHINKNLRAMCASYCGCGVSGSEVQAMTMTTRHIITLLR